MITFSSNPIDIVNEDDSWQCTYRFEPFLGQWFYVEPNMKGYLQLIDSSDVPNEVKENTEKIDYTHMQSYYSPIKVQVQINNDCNYNCSMCYAARNEKKIHLDLINLKMLFAKLKNIGVIRVNLVGGEIFMRKDINEIIDAAIKENLLVSCISNGIIPGKQIDIYKDVLKKLFNIQVSCNGIGENYEKEYGSNNWLEAKKYISNVIQNSSSNILSFVISEDNYKDIPEFLHFANSISPTVVKFGTICWSGRSKSRESVNYYSEVLPKAKELIKSGRNNYPQLQIQSQLDAKGNTPLWEEYSSGYRPFEFYFSPEARDGIYVNVHGDIYPFPLLSEFNDFKVGNIEDDIFDLWKNSNVLKLIRNVEFKSSKCGKLGCKNPCGLWNRSYAYAWSKDLNGKVPCELTKWR